ncbi:MAG: polymerase subunit sigma, partial [Acidimicrobiales bacterium]|nr:polymerase subunit sigma [Acidimicrobiales bacterium]
GRVRAGEAARQTLIEANRRLVVSIARRHVRAGLPTELLLAAGDRALERAVDRYEPRGDLAFNAFARWWIEQAVRAAAATPAGEPPDPGDAGATLLTALGQLHEPDRRVLELRLGLTGGRPMSAGEAAQVLGAAPERVEEAEERALAKLRHPCTPGNLRHLRRI